MQQFPAKKLKVSVVIQCSYFPYAYFYMEEYLFPYIFHRYRYFQFDKGIHIEGISGFELLVQINVVKNSREITINGTIFLKKSMFKVFLGCSCLFFIFKDKNYWNMGSEDYCL